MLRTILKSPYFCLLSAVLLLTACGGGSSSGGGDSNNAAETASDTTGTPPDGTEPDGGDVAGTYIGTGTVTVSGGGLSETVTGPVQITISENNSVGFGDPGDPPVATGNLGAGGNTFTLAIPASFFNDSGIQCAGTLNTNGSVNGDTVSGNVTSSSVTCNGVPLTVTGTFNAQKSGAGAQGRASTALTDVLRSIIAGMVR